MTPSKRLRQIGCGALVFVWFAVLILVPCGAITLISGSEIRLTRSNVPDDYALRVWLLQQANERGFGISTDYTVTPNAGTVCTITTTRFLLWKGVGAAPSRDCECYARQDSGYTLQQSGDSACQVAGV